MRGYSLLLAPSATSDGITRVNDPKVTSVPALDIGCVAGTAVAGATVAGMDVGEAGIWVGSSNAGTTVFVDRGAGLVGDATVTARSHANITTIKIDRNKKIFFHG
jgi:hypothetical protein